MVNFQEIHWSIINKKQKGLLEQVMVEQYGRQSLELFTPSEKVLIYPGENEPTYHPARTAHANLLSTYLSIGATQVRESENKATGSYVIGFNDQGKGVLTFSQTGIGDGRYLEQIKKATIEVNENLKLLKTGRRNLIPEFE